MSNHELTGYKQGKVVRLREGLKYELEQEIDNRIIEIRDETLDKHRSLIQYIRKKYPELS